VDVPLAVTALWTAQAGMINQFISTNQGDRFAELEAHCRFSAENSLRGLKRGPGA
jgi:hypothetical protein